MDTREEVITLSFQWAVGDMRPLEKNLVQLLKSKHHYLITVVSRLIAFSLTFLATYLLLPSVDLWKVFLIALAGSYSVWVSWGMSTLAFRKFEKIQAKDSAQVGWNSVKIDKSGILWSTETSQEYVSWLGISDVVETDGSVWLKTGDAQGYYLPSRIFEAEANLGECLKLIEQFRNESTVPVHVTERIEEPLIKH